MKEDSICVTTNNDDLAKRLINEINSLTSAQKNNQLNIIICINVGNNNIINAGNMNNNNFK